MKILINFSLALLLSFSSFVFAEEDEQRSYTELEILKLSIKLSNDGTGIIKNVTCADCKYKFVTITPATTAYVSAEKVDISRANSRSGKTAFITFYRDTGEVRSIHWSE